MSIYALAKRLESDYRGRWRRKAAGITGHTLGNTEVIYVPGYIRIPVKQRLTNGGIGTIGKIIALGNSSGYCAI